MPRLTTFAAFRAARDAAGCVLVLDELSQRRPQGDTSVRSRSGPERARTNEANP
jgi:hypothetical protein